jgi:predicted Na+-dependent transporter
MPVLTPIAVVLGLLLPHVFITFRPFVPWLFGTITFAGALNLRFREIGKSITDPIPLALFFFSTHVVMPVLAFLAGSLAFPDSPDTVSGYVLLFSIPTAVSGLIWVSIYRGDRALSLSFIFLDTLIAPLVVPFTVSLLLGAKIALDMRGMTGSLLLMVVFPTIAGVLLNETSKGAVPRVISPYLGPFSKLCFVLVISANTSAIASQLNPANPKIWIIGGMGIFLTVLGFLFSKLIGVLGRLSPGKRGSLFFAGGLRNISAAATLAIDFFAPEAALPCILGMLFQQILSALMGRLFLGKVIRSPQI